MKAIVRTQYGSPDELQFAEVPTPSPAGNEVLIKLCAASVNPVDLFALQGAPWNRIPGLRAKPKNTIIGCDIAGRVEAVGRNVEQFQAGDEVFGITGFEGKGFAEYVCASEEKLGRGSAPAARPGLACALASVCRHSIERVVDSRRWRG